MSKSSAVSPRQISDFKNSNYPGSGCFSVLAGLLIYMAIIVIAVVGIVKSLHG